ncbi:MAG TPA: metal ABC transporter substrate-binding protein [Cellulomonas sp.]
MPTRLRAARLALPVAAAVLALGACSPGSSGDGRPSVLASFYPLQMVAQQVGGDRVDVSSLTPPGAEPHDLELSPAQVVRVGNADLVVYLSDFQPAVDDAVAAAPPAHVVDAAKLTTLMPLAGASGTRDPHFWLDPSRMPAVARAVADQLSTIDPAGAATYAANATALSARFDALDAEYASGLATCADRAFVTSHAAFGYLAAHYHLEQVAISGLDPEADPSPDRLAQISRLVKDRGIRTIFFETLVSPKVAETLAADLGVQARVLDPLEGVSDPSQDYFSIAEANLSALKMALSCS